MRERVRVLFFSHTADLGGAELSLLGIVRRLDKCRFEAAVVLPGPGPLAEEIGAEAEVATFPMSHWLGRDPSPGLKTLYGRAKDEVSTMLPFSTAFRPDVVYTNTLMMPHGSLMARRIGRPHIWHVRAFWSRESLPLPSPLFLGLVAATSRRVIANSRAVRRRFPVPLRARVRTVYNGLEFAEPSMCSESGERTADAGPRLVLVGAIQPNKGQMEALQCLEMVLRRYPDTHLTLIGASGDTPYYLRLLNYIDANDLEEHVTFAGFVKDAYRLISRFDLSLMPSWEEPFGRVAVESLAAGVPVIGTRAGGLPEILAEGGSVMVPPHDAAALASAVVDLWASPERQRRLAAEGPAVAARFSMERLMAAIEEEILAAAAR